MRDLWLEILQKTYGKQAFVPKVWLFKEWTRMKKKQRSVKVQTTTTSDSLELSDTLESIQNDLGDCKRCQLSTGRTHLVYGEGNPKATLMFVGEGPGEQEDLQGRPFVGRAGQLLDKIIQAMGFQRKDVYIANVVKCRPPNNRLPQPEETHTCEPFLFRQIACIQPKILVALGATALKSFYPGEVKITKQRGQFMDFRGTKLMPTYHPAYLLRNPPAKKEVWEDMKKVISELKKG